MLNGLLISTIMWPHPKVNKLFQVVGALQGSGPLDQFANIDPLVSEPSVEQDDSNTLQIDEGLVQHLSSEDDKDSCDLEWEFED